MKEGRVGGSTSVEVDCKDYLLESSGSFLIFVGLLSRLIAGVISKFSF